MRLAMQMVAAIDWIVDCEQRAWFYCEEFAADSGG